jgi:hypothetical protein
MMKINNIFLSYFQGNNHHSYPWRKNDNSKPVKKDVFNLESNWKILTLNEMSTKIISNLYNDLKEKVILKLFFMV